MLLVGITGAIGHGKSTFAEALHVYEQNLLHLETNMPIMEIANYLQSRWHPGISLRNIETVNTWLEVLPIAVERAVRRQIDGGSVHITKDQLTENPVEYEKLGAYLDMLSSNPALASTIISTENKVAFRAILQWLGGYLVARIDSQIWIGEVIERAHEFGEQGGTLAVIGGLRFPIEAETVRGAGGVVVKIDRISTEIVDQQDPTERERDGIIPDCTIANSGSVVDLVEIAQVFVDDLRSNEVKKAYSPASIIASSS